MKVENSNAKKAIDAPVNSEKATEKPKDFWNVFLVSGFNPSEKYYSSQNGNLPQIGVKIKHI